jgi:hypothetical protein
MRHDIRQDLKDICIELTDMGIYPKYTFTGHGNILIKDTFDDRGDWKIFTYDKIKDVVDRIKHFMSMRGYKTEIIKIYDCSNIVNRLINKLNGNVQRVHINFLHIEIDKFFGEYLRNK